MVHAEVEEEAMGSQNGASDGISIMLGLSTSQSLGQKTHNMQIIQCEVQSLFPIHSSAGTLTLCQFTEAIQITNGVKKDGGYSVHLLPEDQIAKSRGISSHGRCPNVDHGNLNLDSQ